VLASRPRQATAAAVARLARTAAAVMGMPWSPLSAAGPDRDWDLARAHGEGDHKQGAQVEDRRDRE
jgi:hypothetical protein